MKKLESKTVKELIAMAREWGLSGYSRLKKAELLKLLTKKISKTAVSHSKGKKKTSSKSEPASKTGKKSAGKTKNGTRASAASNIARKARTLVSKARLSRRKASRKQGRYSRPAITELKKRKKIGQSQKPIDTGLPFSYGDGRFGLMARDPHWLYCFWDLSPEQQQKLWESGHAVLRVLRREGKGQKLMETISLTHGAQSWYVYVKDADCEYFCELGCVEQDGSISTVASSNPSTTPPDFASRQKKSSKGSGQPKLSALEPDSFTHEESAGPSGPDTDAEHAIVHGQLKQDISSDSHTQASAPSSYSLHQASGESSAGPGHSPGQHGTLFHTPTGSKADAGEYWLAMDADIVLYGSTQAGSKLILAGIPLELDDNGHFRARFALPDGSHSFSLEATSPDEAHHREMLIKIVRGTES